MERYLPLLLAAFVVPGILAGRAADRRELARTAFRTILWVTVPLLPIVLASSNMDHAGPAVAIALCTSALVAGASTLYARRRFADPAERAAFAISAWWANTGWLGLPMCAALLGPEAVPAASLYAVSVSPLHFALGGSMAAAGGLGARPRLFDVLRRNRALIPALIGVAWALSPLPTPPPSAAHAVTWLLIATAAPAFFAFGLVLARAPLAPDRDVAAAVGLRMAASPVLLAAAATLVYVPRAFVLQAGMATGINTLALASEHGLPLARVAPTVAWTTGLAVAGGCAWLLLT